MTARRGEVWWAELPGLGRRPAVLVSADALNRVLTHVTAARITSVERERALPTHVRIDPVESGLPQPSFVLCHELHTLPADALGERAGGLGPLRMTEVEQGLRFGLDLEP